MTTQQSLGNQYKDVSAQWHPSRNGALTPYDVTSSSNKVVWWQCPVGHEWEARIQHRTAGAGCPYCSGRKVLPGYNDLATTNLHLIAEWNYSRNGDLRPEMVSKGSGKKVWWICSKGHEWVASITNRAKGTGCPYCSSKRVVSKQNDLATLHPQIAAEWHPFNNNDLSPCDISAGSGKKVWWQCRCGHEWQAVVADRVKGTGCPFCAGKKVIPGVNDLKTNNQDLSLEWNHEKNYPLTPAHVMTKSHLKVWWICSQRHEWQASIASRSNGSRCPLCARQRVSFSQDKKVK